uniref:Mediator of RNA polymerase II transcription subunit 6 n=1 Tax=Ascaris lumbricoides TaxID=6252 RepID=A0A0M3IPE5_ASCLU
MQGIQFAVVGANHPLYVIVKQRRNSPTNGREMHGTRSAPHPSSIPTSSTFMQSMQGIQFAVVGANHPLYVIVKQRRNSPTNVLKNNLKSMQGIQFAVVGANHPLYVIVKQRRNSPTNVTPLCYYYVVNGTVYQCPDIYTFVQSKLIGAVDPLRRALEQARQFSRYNVAKGYYWEFKEPTAESEKKEKKEEEKPLTARSTFFQRTRTEQLLRDLFEKFPPPDDVKFEFDSGEVASGETSAADRSDAPSRIGQETGGSMPPEGQQQQTGGTSRQNVTGPASVPPLQTHQNGGAHETGGPMSFPGPAMNGHHENGDVKRFKME